MSQRALITFLLLLLATFPANAESAGTPEPVGDEFQVNTYTMGYQGFVSAAADDDGDFIMVWESDGSAGSDLSFRSIQGQHFDSTGTPVGNEFQVNTYTTSWQARPAVVADTDGDFVVVWASYGSSGSDSSGYSIQAQRFDEVGMPVGDEFQVNTYTTDNQRNPAVAADADGDFVVVWQSDGSSGSDSSGYSIQAQRFDSTGARDGQELQVNTYTTSWQSYPSVAADINGNFVVVWESEGSGGSDSSFGSVQGQRFDTAGGPVGDEFQVNTFTPGSQRFPAVAFDAAGGFVVVWHGVSWILFSEDDILGRRFDSAGAPVGQDFLVNTYTTDIQFRPAVAADANGGFVVVWHSDGSTGSDSSLRSVQGQRFDSSGALLGHHFQVNSYTTGNQWKPAVAADRNGNFVVAWSSNGSSGSDSDWYSIQGQRFAVPIFADGFESGNTSAWSSAVP